MKTKYLSILVSILSLSLVSCKFVEDDIFDASAAVRLNTAKSEYRKVLTNATNGWLMEYFATSESQGYTFLMKFSDAGTVTIAAKNDKTTNVYKTESSFYDIIADNGPVLTFNTFNSLFSAFANPENPDGYGLEGDYEFIVLKADSNEVKLKGKKRGTYIYLRKLDINQTWPSYFTKLEVMKKAMLTTNVDFLNLVIAKDTIKVFKTYEDEVKKINLLNIFAFLEKDGDPVSDKKLASFIITNYGIRFHSSHTYYDKTFQDFALSADSSKLISKENSSVYFEGPVLNSYLKSSTSTWKIDTTQTSSNFKSRIAILKKALKTGYTSKNFEYFGISNKASYQNAFVIKLTKTEGTYRIDFTTKPNNIVEISMPTTNVNLYDNNGKAFFNKTPEVNTTLRYFCGEYKVTTSTPLAINSVRYERTTDSNEFFTIIR